MNTITLFFGGIVNLGGSMNALPKKRKLFVNLGEMVDADLRLVDLECVIASTGSKQLVPDTHRYFRARPEQINFLVKADTDIVLTANDHSCDYGAEALLEQKNYLDVAGILCAGSGRNIFQAFAPVYKKISEITVAIFSVDTTMPTFTATADSPGIAHLPEYNLEVWEKVFAEKIREARERADAVIVAPHWGVPLAKKPSEDLQKIAHLLIDLGADAVLGCHSHILQGVENYKNRPIIYGAGDFLFNTASHSGGCFTLEISPSGVEKIKFIPLVVRDGRTYRAKRSAAGIIKDFVGACEEFKTVADDSEGSTVEILFNPPSRQAKNTSGVVGVKAAKNLIAPFNKPRSEWTVAKVPDAAIIPPKNFDGLKLIGYYVPPDSRIVTERKMIFIETYWTIEEPIKKDCRLSIIAAPNRECRMRPFDSGEHEILDYMYPVDRWKPGVIYHEKIALAPPKDKLLVNLNLQVILTVKIDGNIVGGFMAPDFIVMNLPDRLRHNLKFDEIIYQSEPGKCWTAEQLAKVMDGEWIFPPPKNWCAQSFRKITLADTPRPNLLVLDEKAPNRVERKIFASVDNFDGAIVACDVQKVPPNFPVLKVDNPVLRTRELGFAARKRFQGRVIAVTGSAGKTTTCNMLNFVLRKDHSVTATPGSSNMYRIVPRIFAGVKQDDAYAVIEMSIDAFEKVPGSVCYEIMPHIAVVTSIMEAHIGGRGSLEVIAINKSRIFCGMAPGGYAVLNRDMPCYEILEERAKSFGLNVITFGTHPDAFVRMPVISYGGEFFVDGKPYKLFCPVPNDQLYDALAVIAVTTVAGLSVEKILEYLKEFSPVSGRGNILQVKRGGKNLKIIDSTFNANVISITYALEYLKNVEPNQKRRVAVLGDIASLGVFSIELHKKLVAPLLEVEADRILLCGEFMYYPYEMIKDKVNTVWFKTLDELLQNVETYLRDGDTVLVKSSHDTGLSKVVDLLNQASPPKPFVALNVPSALFDVKEFLPEGMLPSQNGIISKEKLLRIHCGGQLYRDAARSWLAMVRAAAQDKIFLSLNHPFQSYRKLESQIAVFKKRFTPLDNTANLSADAICVEFENKIWQLNENAVYATVPGTSSHGFGLAVDIENSGNIDVKAWLDKNAEQFGFVREYDFEYWHFTYIKSREGIPARVLEIESLPPEPLYSALQILAASGCKWIGPPSEKFFCHGVLLQPPLRPGYFAVVDQGAGIGFKPQIFNRTFRQIAGFIAVDPAPLVQFSRPIIISADLADTVNRLKDFLL